MRIERLVTMANDIATYFTTEPDHAAAVISVRDHLKRFWDPAMRRQIKDYLVQGGDGLMPLAKEAIAELEVPPADAA